MTDLNTITHPDSQVSALDRLAFTLLLALVVHFLIWAGWDVALPMSEEPPERKVISTLHVTLTKGPAEKVTEPVKHIAEQDQQASGQTDLDQEPVQAATPPPPSVTEAVEQEPVPPLPEQQASVEQDALPEPEVVDHSPVQPVPEPQVEEVVENHAEPIVEETVAEKAIEQAPAKLKQVEAVIEPEVEAKPEPLPVAKQEPLKATEPVKAQQQSARAVEQPNVEPDINAQALLERSLEIARLEAEQKALANQYAQRPKVRTLSTQTATASDDVFYLRQWQERIERVGNLNYPERARAEKLSGRLRVLVSLEPDGSLRDVRVLESSGHDVLDRAAISIVRLSAPFAPFPPSIRERTDILEIIRTWQFGDGN